MRIATWIATVPIMTMAMQSDVLAQPAQSAEGAQVFLESVLPGTDVVAHAHVFNDGVKLPRTSGAFTEWQADGSCGYSFDILEKASGDGGGRMQRTISGDSFAILVLAERRGETEVYFRNKSGEAYSVYAGSEAIADRITYAMNFLMQHCDTTAATGF